MHLEKLVKPSIFSDELQRPGPESTRDKQKDWFDKNENTDLIFREEITKIFHEVSPLAINTYPDTMALYQKIANDEGLDIENLLLAAGSDAAIKTVFETFISPGDTVLHSDPTYAMYYVYCKMFGANEELMSYERGVQLPKLDLASIKEKIEKTKPKLVCLPNPDSPTGTVLTPDQILGLLQSCQSHEAFLLIDEAYYPFYSETALPHVRDHQNLLVTRTFAKAWSCAGLRIGYLAGHSTVMPYLKKYAPCMKLIPLP